MIHAYSLVHDDLPCMDDDVLRRGKPTLHVEYDEATALLAGDALQALAFQLLAEHRLADDPAAQLADGARACPCRRLARHGGRSGDRPGVDGKPLTLPELELMHICKTGALIRAAVALGAACGRSLGDAQGAKLDHYAKCVGLAFQVVDDVLDAEASTATLGKTAGKDARQGKPTYVIDHGRRRRARVRRDAAARRPRRAGGFRHARAPAGRAGGLHRAEEILMAAITGVPDGLPREDGDARVQDYNPAMYELLRTIDDPAALRRLERKQLKQLADELRAFVLESVSTTGGHLSSNLGTVELTIALHYVFDTPEDRHRVGRRATRPTRTRSSPAGARPWPGCACWAASPAFPRRSESALRHLRHGALLDLDLGRARHGDRSQAEG